MTRYFKLVCTWPDKTEWLISEFMNGRVRFGWSGPGTDLRNIAEVKNPDVLSEEQRITWRYCQFLVTRVKPGDRVVVQFERPLRQFYVAEVKEPTYTYDGTLVDFNHILNCKPLIQSPVDVESREVSYSLRKVLSHRGHYFEIYPEHSIEEMDRLVDKFLQGTVETSTGVRTDSHELREMQSKAISTIIQVISTRWRAQDFERFIARLLENVPGVAVQRKADIGQGWDMLIQVFDPLSNEVLLDEVPVQCKNYSGQVDTERPIEDLKRCIRNLPFSTVAYLFIIGDMDVQYRARISKAQEEISTETGRNVQFKVIDQELIAELYLKYFDKLQ